MSEPMSDTRLQEIAARDEARTPGKWDACDGGKCQCKQVWSDDFPIAKIEHGEWGDEYPTLRLEGLEGSELTRKAVAYIDRIVYGEISEDTATANVAFIAACSEDVPALLQEVERLRQRERELCVLLAWSRGLVTLNATLTALGIGAEAFVARLDELTRAGEEIVEGK